MSVWSFDEIARATGGRWLNKPGVDAAPPVGAAIDSREVQPGMLFVAYRGERVDGHRYLGQAESAGSALAFVTEQSAAASVDRVPVLLVPDATDALERSASLWRGCLEGLRVIGVTGSNGKTTTCRLLHAAACAGGEGALTGTHTQKSYNNAIGVPLTVLNARRGDAVLIAEIGMSTPGEISARCATARPDAAIITTVSDAHLEGMGSIEAIAAEKASIASGLSDGAPLFMPAGIAELEVAVSALPSMPRVVRVGAPGQACDHVVGGLHAEGRFTKFSLDGRRLAIPMQGAHNAMNAALSALAASWLGVPMDAIERGLSAASPAPMRLERVSVPTEPPILVINDAYNANPASMRAALAVLSAEVGGRRVAVLGDMLELGDASDRAHREVLGYAQQSSDLVLTIGPCFADAGGVGVSETDDSAVRHIADQIRPGDVVLLKGSRGTRVERVLNALADPHSHGGSPTCST